MDILSRIDCIWYLLDTIKMGYLLLFLVVILWLRFLISVAERVPASQANHAKREVAKSVAARTKETRSHLESRANVL